MTVPQQTVSWAEQPTDGDFELMIKPGVDTESRGRNETLEKFFLECDIALGGGGVDIDLEDDEFNFCFNRALEEFRGLSTRSVYESYAFLKLTPNVQIYRLHRAVDNIIALYRKRALFGSNNTGFDYFSQIAAGMIYPGSQPGGYMGIATYDFALQYEETLNRLFARDIRFTFRPEINTLVLLQVPRSDEFAVCRCMVLKTIDELMGDHWARLWLQKYTIAMAKSILANKWGKFPQLPGAQGGVQINWQKYAQEAQLEIKELREQIYRLEDGGTPPYPMMA
jgi:hypothetical protein